MDWKAGLVLALLTVLALILLALAVLISITSRMRVEACVLL